MKPYLLIGAGFSRNWGGWLADEAFEYLLGHPEVVRSAPLRDLLWKNQPEGGFEWALDELRQIAQRETSQQLLLAALESAIVSSGYNLQPFEFPNDEIERAKVMRFFEG